MFCRLFSDDLQGVREALKRNNIAVFQCGNLRFWDPVFMLYEVGGHHLTCIPDEEIGAVVEAEFLDVGCQMGGQGLFFSVGEWQRLPPREVAFSEGRVTDEGGIHGAINSME